jgi:hypothetical protein
MRLIQTLPRGSGRKVKNWLENPFRRELVPEARASECKGLVLQGPSSDEPAMRTLSLYRHEGEAAGVV